MNTSWALAAWIGLVSAGFGAGDFSLAAAWDLTDGRDPASALPTGWTKWTKAELTGGVPSVVGGLTLSATGGSLQFGLNQFETSTNYYYGAVPLLELGTDSMSQRVFEDWICSLGVPVLTLSGLEAGRAYRIQFMGAFNAAGQNITIRQDGGAAAHLIGSGNSVAKHVVYSRYFSVTGSVSKASVAFTFANLAGTGNSYGITAMVVQATPPPPPEVDVYYSWSPFAGQSGGPGVSDGTGAEARFNFPRGLAADAAGNLFVADFENQTVRKVSPAGVVTTLAGKGGEVGVADGAGTEARFFQPSGVAVDSAGTVYVADANNQLVRKISTAGVVSTLAGSVRRIGAADGTGTDATFYFPEAVATDPSGNVYASDKHSHTIRKITPSGVVTTLAGLAGEFGATDGVGAAARFNYPAGIVVNSKGTRLFVVDSANHAIRQVDLATRAVTTLAGSAGMRGFRNGSGSAARFYFPDAIARDGADSLYVADAWNHVVRKVTPGGVVTTFAGANGEFADLAGIAVDAVNNVYVADNHQILKVANGTGAVSVFAGRSLLNGYADGTGSAAQFHHPQGGVLDGAGNLYVADTRNHLIRKVTPAGVVTTVSGTKPVAPNTTPVSGLDNKPSSASSTYAFPSSLALSADGQKLYVCDSFNSVVRVVALSNGSTITRGGPGFPWKTYGFNDGTTGTGVLTTNCAFMAKPYGVALDPGGNLLIADWGNHAIRMMNASGYFSTIAGAAPNPAAAGYPNDEAFGVAGAVDATGHASRFRNPEGLATDAAGTIYVADTWNHTIRKITAGNVVTTLAGAAGLAGSVDASGINARFNRPSGVGVAPNGALFVSETGSHTIRRIAPDGTVTTIGGLAGVTGTAGGLGAEARFSKPYGIVVSKAVDAQGNPALYVMDSANNRIVKGVPTYGLMITSASALPPATRKAAYSQPLAARGGTEPYAWTKVGGSLPKGLSLSPAGVLGGTPSATGLFTLTLRVEDAEAQAAEAQFQLVVNQASATYEDWKASRFSTNELQDLSVSGDLADPDLDGVKNMVEYAMALEPRDPEASEYIAVGNDGGFLTFTYRQNQDAADLIYTVECAESLAGEHGWLADTVEVSRFDTELGWWEVTVRDRAPISETTTRFVRLKVTKP